MKTPKADASLVQAFRVLQQLERSGVDTTYVNVVASGGVVQLWGLVRSEGQRETAMAAATAAGAQAIDDHLGVLHPSIALWTD